MHLKLPHDATHPDQEYSMPDPDALLDAYEVICRLCFATPSHEGAPVTVPYHELALVMMLAFGYLDLTTYELGQEHCVGKLRDIWRARRAREREGA